MHMRQPALGLVLAAALAMTAGCTATGASAGNFELVPERVGWYVGDTANFTLNITPSITRQEPGYTLDRHFAIEEIRYEDKGGTFGGDFKTRDPEEVRLKLLRDGVPMQEVALDATHPTVVIQLDVPEKLRDSEYVLEIKLFKVGWVKSDLFRVDVRSTGK